MLPALKIINMKSLHFSKSGHFNILVEYRQKYMYEAENLLRFLHDRQQRTPGPPKHQTRFFQAPERELNLVQEHVPQVLKLTLVLTFLSGVCACPSFLMMPTILGSC